ncbi:hypothetical protein Y032_0732g1917 [Ancylostoma ceylanicum]|uniref:Uncharacterized protein n=1 Tax=Ancylostoma ceylanicum TaxID=53326 RepID=A0A016WEG2_9BILA|nr:hypothetical protein Y032_0732g1917 [Ancylostoma ceylanicum]
MLSSIGIDDGGEGGSLLSTTAATETAILLEEYSGSLCVRFPPQSTVIKDLSRFDKLLGNEADLQTLVDITQELFPLELLGKLACSLLEVCLRGYCSGILQRVSKV